MEEIKFRFLDLNKLEIISHDNIHRDHAYYFISDPKKHEIIPMQYSGLKDCKGVEIYEGDIVLGYTKPHEVIFIDCAFYLKNKNSSIRLSRTCGMLEVIGNIYETPELL